jgi:hypothetical protein
VIPLILQAKRNQLKADSRTASSSLRARSELLPNEPKMEEHSPNLIQKELLHVPIQRNQRSYAESDSSQLDFGDYETRLAAVEQVLLRAKLGQRSN